VDCRAAAAVVVGLALQAQRVEPAALVEAAELQ
jgi:hypothetical protein